MVRFAEEKDLDRINELRKQVNDIHVNMIIIQYQHRMI